MEYLHAALVLHSSGKKITEKGIQAVIKAAGSTPDDAKIKALVATLSTINIDEAIKGASLMPSVPVTAVGTEPSKDTQKGTKEEEEEEEEEKGDDLGLSSLFG